MKQFLLILCLLGSHLAVLSQESFNKKYSIPGWIKMSGGDKLYLTKDSATAFKDLPDSVKKKIGQEYPIGHNLTVTKELIMGGEKRTITQIQTVDSVFYHTLSTSVPTPIDTTKTPLTGFVKFEENKVIVNPYLRKTKGKYTDLGMHYFKLKNRQTIKLSFKEYTVSTLIIPIKYRFKDGEIPEDFATAFNANFFIGKSWGKTSFSYREKVDNKSNTWKYTLGLLLGAAVTELNASNTKYAKEPLTGDVKYNKGLASFGLGGTYSLNKINVGLFYGWDFAIGESADKWNYNGRPWLGLAIGYGLFNM